MRKVLLASTALFALGSVSAMAADITISGGFELGYDSEADQSDGTRITSETDWNVMFSNTTDSGITTSLNYGFDESGGVDDQNYSIAGPFGTIAVANASDGDDGAVDAMDVEADTVAENSVWASHTSGYTTAYAGGWSASLGTGDRISYTLPSIMEGLTVAVQHLNEAGDESFAYGASMQMGAVKVVGAKMAGTTAAVAGVAAVAENGTGNGVTGVAAANKMEVEGTHMGLSASVSGLTLEYGLNNYERTEIATAGGAETTREGKGTRIGASYAVGDITLGYEDVAAEWDASATETVDTYKYTSIGAAYPVATGITAKLAVTDGEIYSATATNNKNEYSTTRLSVSVAF